MCSRLLSSPVRAFSLKSLVTLRIGAARDRPDSIIGHTQANGNGVVQTGFLLLNVV